MQSAMSLYCALAPVQAAVIAVQYPVHTATLEPPVVPVPAAPVVPDAPVAPEAPVVPAVPWALPVPALPWALPVPAAPWSVVELFEGLPQAPSSSNPGSNTLAMTFVAFVMKICSPQIVCGQKSHDGAVAPNSPNPRLDAMPTFSHAQCARL
jgi:hypothetical protein